MSLPSQCFWEFFQRFGLDKSSVDGASALRRRRHFQLHNGRILHLGEELAQVGLALVGHLPQDFGGPRIGGRFGEAAALVDAVPHLGGEFSAHAPPKPQSADSRKPVAARRCQGLRRSAQTKADRLVMTAAKATIMVLDMGLGSREQGFSVRTPKRVPTTAKVPVETA
jgi:hypothetical protein